MGIKAIHLQIKLLRNLQQPFKMTIKANKRSLVFASILLLVCLINTSIVAGENYLCVTEASGGVKYNGLKGKYEGLGFDTTTNLEKIVVKKVENTKWRIENFGSSIDNSIKCDTFNDSKKTISLSCDLIFGHFGINFDNLRFYITYLIPALTDPSKYSESKKIRDFLDQNTPYIAVGSCSKF